MQQSVSSKHLRLGHLLALIFLVGLFQGCAQLEPSVPLGAPVGVPTEKGVSYDGRDNIQEAYSDFLLASISASRGNHEEARQYLSDAIEKDPGSPYLYQKMATLLKEIEKYTDALIYATKCVDLDPKNVKAMVLLADLYALTGNDALSIEQYEKALGFDPKNRRIRLLLTTILIKKDLFTDALRHLEVLTKQNPELIIAHYYRGRISLEMGRYQEAEKALAKALELNNSLEPALFDLGTLYQVTDRPAKAVETYKKLLEFYPDNMATKERLVNLYLKLGLKEKAEQEMQEIKRISRPGEPGRQALGLIYLRQGRLDESINELKLIVSAWPKDHKSRYYLATAYEEKGDIEEALEHFRLIRPESNYYINAQMHIAHLLSVRKRYEEAIAVLERAITSEKGRSELYLMLSSIYETKKEYAKAKAVIKEGLEQDEKNIELIFRLGVLFDKSGDKASCIEQMRKILGIDPGHADSLNYIGYTYAEQGVRLDEAMDLIQKAIKLKPDSGYIIDSLGWVYYQKGLYDEAARYLEKAATLEEKDPTINEHLGDVYFKLNKFKKALAYYEKALSLKPADEKKLRDKITEVRQLLKHRN